MTMLWTIGRSAPRLTGRNVFCLFAAGMLVCAVPTLRRREARETASDQQRADTAEAIGRAGVDPADSPVRPAERPKPAEEPRASEERIAELIAQLSSDDGRVRGRAVYELGKIGPAAAPAVPALIAMLGDRLAPIIVPEEDTHGTQVSIVATNALVTIGEPAVEPLLRVLREKDPKRDVRDHAARALGKIGDPLALQPLLEALDHEKQPVRSAASSALGEMGEAAFRPLADRLRHPSLRVQLGAIRGIVRINQAAISRTGRTTRREQSVKLLAAQLDDESPRVRGAALSGLRSLGRTAAVTDRLLAMIDDPNADVRAEVFGALGDARDPRAVSVFLAGLKDPYRYVRYRSADGLGQLRAKQGVEPLLRALESDDGRLRELAAAALGQIGDRRAFTLLLELANTDEEPDVRADAGRAIGKIMHPEVPPSRIAWGEPVGDLQLGLRCRSGSGPYYLGEIVRYERVIRNTGNRNWTVYVTLGGRIIPHVEDGKIVLHSGRIVSGDLGTRRVRVPAGRSVTLDETEFSLRPVGWKKPDRSHMLQLAPGKYRVSTIYLPEAPIGPDAREGTWTERLTTGELELTVLAASAGGSDGLAPVPRE